MNNRLGTSLVAVTLVALLNGSASACTSAGRSASESDVAKGGESTIPDMSPGAKLENVAGHVVRVSDEWWGLVPDFDAGTRFAPTPALTAEYREEGLRVVWSGTVGEVRADVRMWGVPLAVTALARESAGAAE